MKKFIFAFLFVSFFISCAKTGDQRLCGCSPISSNSLYDANYKYGDEKGWVDLKITDTVKNDSITLHSYKNSAELILKFPFRTDSTVLNKTIKNFTATYIRHNTNLTQAQLFKPDSTAANTVPYSGGSTGVGVTFKLTFKLSNPTGNPAVDTLRAYFPNALFQVRIK